MKNKRILFLSSNRIWSGSEVLWASAARQLKGRQSVVKAGVLYDADLLRNYLPGEECICLREKSEKRSFLSRVLQRLSLIDPPDSNPLRTLLLKIKPELVIISQGNNMDGRKFMKACRESSFPYITLTHLVNESIWPALNDEIIDELRQLYQEAKRNFYVSHATWQMNEEILGQSFSNSAVVYNPFRQTERSALPFPGVRDGLYKIALVGRIEIFHKGYDLLIHVLKQEKWRQRPLQFSLYGRGPHVRILNRLIKFHGIMNFQIHEHQDDIAAIWAGHHMLIMPSRMEGQALSLIEAMRYGRAAIVTRVGGSTELIDEPFCGFVADHATVESLDACLERAWEKRDVWEQLGSNAFKAISERHPADAVSFFNQLVEDVLARSESLPESR